MAANPCGSSRREPIDIEALESEATELVATAASTAAVAAAATRFAFRHSFSKHEPVPITESRSHLPPPTSSARLKARPEGTRRPEVDERSELGLDPPEPEATQKAERNPKTATSRPTTRPSTGTSQVGSRGLPWGEPQGLPRTQSELHTRCAPSNRLLRLNSKPSSPSPPHAQLRRPETDAEAGDPPPDGPHALGCARS